MVDTIKKLQVEMDLNNEKVLSKSKQVVAEFEKIGKAEAKISKASVAGKKQGAKLDAQTTGPKAKREAKIAQKQGQENIKQLNAEIRALKQLQREYAKLAAEKKKNTFGARLQREKRFDKTIGGKPSGMGIAGAGAMAGGMAVAAVAAAVGALIGAISSQISQGYGKYSQFASAQAGLVGSGTTRGQVGRTRQAGVGLGFGPQQTIEQMRQVALATGQSGATNTAQAMARTTMMDVGGASSFMGTMTRGGQGFGGKAGKAGNKELIKMLALGTKAGIDDARMTEYFQSISRVTEQQSARLGGDINATGFAKILQAFGGTGQSGLQGSRGGAVLSKLNEAIVKPGGGETGQALMLQAMGFGRPGGDTTYYEARKKQQEGATPENIKRMFGETRAQYGGGQEQILALETMTGLSITQLEGVRDAVENMSGETRQAEIEKILAESQPVEKQALDKMGELGEHAVRKAELDLRLLEIGEVSKDSLESMQDSINKLVSTFMPKAIEVLEEVAELLRAFADFEGFGIGGKTQKEMLTSGHGSVNKFKKLDADWRAGKITAEEYKTQKAMISSSMTVPINQVENSVSAGYFASQQKNMMRANLQNPTGMEAMGGGRFSPQMIKGMINAMADPESDLGKKLNEARGSRTSSDDQRLAEMILANQTMQDTLLKAAGAMSETNASMKQAVELQRNTGSTSSSPVATPESSAVNMSVQPPG